MGRVRSAATAAVLATVLGAAPLLAACSGGSGSAGPDTSPTSESPTPTPPADALAALSSVAAAVDFTGTYALDSTDPKRPDGTVRVYRKGQRYRIDVDVAGTSSRLYTTAAGAVSCQVTAAKKACLLVAKPGQPLPKLFDPGLQRVFTSSLGAFSSGAGLTVESAGTLPATATLPVAQCFTVIGTGVDPGEYCFTQTGLLRRAQFPSGTLTLQSATSSPDVSAFVPPVQPTPLPT